MAGTFTRSIFYKLPASPDVEVQYTGVTVASGSPYQYRITNNNPVGSFQAYAGATTYTVSPTTRSTTATGSPAIPTTAGSSITIYIQELSPGASAFVAQASTATVTAISPATVNPTQSYSTSPQATINHSPSFSVIGQGGTLEVNKTSPDNSTYPTTGWVATSALTVTRGNQYNIWVRRGVGVANEGRFASFATTTSVPFLGLSATVTSLSVGGVTNASPGAPYQNTVSPVAVSWTGTVSPGWYRVVLTNPSPTSVVVTGAQGLTSGTITDLPISPGRTYEYRLQVKRDTADGGGNTYTDANPTTGQNPFYIQRAPFTATARSIVAATRSPSGDLKTSEFNSDVIVNFTGTQNQRYKIVRTSGTVADVKVGSILGSTGATSLNISPSFFPAEGSSSAYEIQTIRETAQNGDNTWYATSPASAAFTILKILQPTVSDSQSFDSTTNSSTISHNIQLKANGAGGTLQYAISTSATYNTSLIGSWQSSPKVTLTRGNTYYMWGRRSTEAGDADGSTLQTVPLYVSPVDYGLRVYSSTGSTLLDISSRISRQLTKGGPTTINNGATTTISVPTLGTADDSAVAVLYSPTSATNPFYISPNYTAKTFTVTNNSGGTRNIYYYVINTGEV